LYGSADGAGNEPERVERGHVFLAGELEHHFKAVAKLTGMQ
jgi:hypothetical protein